MGIRFLCHACDRKLNVKSFLAGKKGICPHCGARIRIPEESQLPSSTTRSVSIESAPESTESVAAPSAPISSTPATATASPAAVAAVTPTAAATVAPVQPAPVSDPLIEDPDAVWYVRPPSGGQFGPADGDVMQRWIREGRVSKDSLVWKEGWPEWLKANEALPSFGASTAQAVASTPSASPMAATPIPASTPTAVSNPSVSGVASSSASTTGSTEPAASSSSAASRRPQNKGMGIAIISLLGLMIVALTVVLIIVVSNRG